MKTIKPLISLAVLFVITAISSIASAAGDIAVDPNATNFNPQNVKTVGLSGNFGWIALAAGLGIGLALIESLVIYALIISLLLVLKVG